MNVTLFENGVSADLIQVKGRLYQLWVAPKSSDWHYYKKRERHTHRQTSGERAMGQWRQRLEWCNHKLRYAKDLSETIRAGKKQGRILPKILQGLYVHANTSISTSSPKTLRINFCCFKPNTCNILLQQPLDMNRNTSISTLASGISIGHTLL